jgi:hypothetical protein
MKHTEGNIMQSVVNRLGIAGELLRFLGERKWWWLSPMILILLFLVYIAFFAESSSSPPIFM